MLLIENLWSNHKIVRCAEFTRLVNASEDISNLQNERRDAAAAVAAVSGGGATLSWLSLLVSVPLQNEKKISHLLFEIYLQAKNNLRYKWLYVNC